MSDDTSVATLMAPDRRLPLIHALFATVATACLYAPFLELGDGRSLTLMDLSGAWGGATGGTLALLGVAALLLIIADRVSWARLLVVDMLIVVALIPVVVGVLLNWEPPEAGVAGFAWGFWGALVLLVARFPVSIWIRTRAARVQTYAKQRESGAADE